MSARIVSARGWVRGHGVVLAGLAMVAGQLGWTVVLVSRAWFRQTDFVVLDRALREGFGWKYLTWLNGGHLMPAGQALSFLIAHVSRYGWRPAGIVIITLAAVASLAMLRMLLTVFGSRWEVLLVLAVYLFTPLALGAVAWWWVAVRVLPFLAAMFLAIDAHVRYVRSRRARWLAAAAAWIVVAMLAANQAVLVPVLLFVLTAVYFGGYHGLARAWALYGALAAAWCAVFFTVLAGSGVPVSGPGMASSLYRFFGSMVGDVAVPSLLGGPWHWTGFAQAQPPSAAKYASWIVVALVVLVSCMFRVGAWRAWAILLGWIVAASVLPATIRGFGGLPVTALGQQSGYLASGTGVLALCLGLAFLPAGEERPAPRRVRLVALAGWCAFLGGAAVSAQAFVPVAGAAAARSYITTASAAIAAAPRGSLVLDGPTPPAVIDPAFFGGSATTAQVLRPLAGDRLTWLSMPNGVYQAAPLIFNGAGRLRPATVTGVVVRPRHACFTVGSLSGVTITLHVTLYRWTWTVLVAYSGPAGTLAVRMQDGAAAEVPVPAGRHVAYLSVVGSGGAVVAQFFGSGTTCVSRITVGSLASSAR